MKYKIETSNDIEQLENSVQESIVNGWEPQGGVVVFTQGIHVIMMQAMVMEVVSE